MNTLADLKRELKIGRKLFLLYRNKPLNTPITRVVSKVQSNGVSFIDPDNPNSNNSFLPFPKSSLLEVLNNGFKIYDRGMRDLTDDEKYIINNEPRDPERERIDVMSDSNTMFYERKKYYRDMGAEYLFGEKKGGMFYSYNKGVFDDRVKGRLCLEYRFIDN